MNQWRLHATYWNLNGTDISTLSKDDIKALHRIKFPDASCRVIAANAGMIFRCATEITKESTVVMYDPATRLYHIGKVSGPCAFVSPKDSDDDDGSYRCAVNWKLTAPRDALSVCAKHSLGSISTLFAVSADTLRELEKASNGACPAEEEESEEENSSEVREATAEDGIERVKDRVLQLSWDDMKYIVAGVLRSMGYKTSMTPRGSDGGRDNHRIA